MKVLKFGGTSVGSVKSILSLKRIVENEDVLPILLQRENVLHHLNGISG